MDPPQALQTQLLWGGGENRTEGHQRHVSATRTGLESTTNKTRVGFRSFPTGHWNDINNDLTPDSNVTDYPNSNLSTLWLVNPQFALPSYISTPRTAYSRC